MAEASPQPSQNLQSETGTPSITDLLKVLSCCVNAAECHHDTNPWSDSDPELQIFSTAALEALQEHTTRRMKSLLHMHEVLDKEIANRKLESRFKTSTTTESDSKPSEVLFNAHDLEPLIVLLGAQDSTSEVVGVRPGSERRDSIARMCLAWISETREAARLSRTDVTTRPTSVKHRNRDEVDAIIDIEGTETGSISFQDVEALEDEMEDLFEIDKGTPAEMVRWVSRHAQFVCCRPNPISERSRPL